MRILLVLPLAATAAACNVSTDANNSAMTVQYNQETAQNAASDVGNHARRILSLGRISGEGNRACRGFRKL